MVDMLQKFGGEDDVAAWEPTTEHVLKSFSKWLMHNPSPKWILTDSATYFTSQRMMDFAGHAGIGLLTTPAEAHHMLGAEEGAINIIRNTVTRLLKDEMDLDVEMAYQLASHGNNATIGPSGFSPFQWVRGSSAPIDNIPVGVNPRRAFDGMLKLKEKARIAFEVESARSRLSKLNNTTPKPVQVFKMGQLAMLWRQRARPGKMSGSWIGPVRVLLQEGGTVWAATGATLIRARTIQLRACTRREEMQATLEGTAILKMPTTLESLLRNFTGRHFSDVSGDTPSEEQLQDDLQGAEVQQEPAVNVRPDTWTFKQDGGKRWLVRIHNMPRLSLFSPQRVGACPLDENELTGIRQTKLKGMFQGAEQVIINDDYKTSEDPHRSLQDRWTGETWLEIKPETKAAQGPSSKTRKIKLDKKRKAEDEIQPGPPPGQRDEVQGDDAHEEQAADDRAASSTMVPDDGKPAEHLEGDPPKGALLPHVPGISPLTTALRNLGPGAVDGVPAGTTESSTRCSVPACCAPGGHYGPHEDADGIQFTWDAYQGRVNLDGDQVSNDSDSSEELLPEEPPADKALHMLSPGQPETYSVSEPPKDVFYALEIDILPSDTKYLTQNADKIDVWMSRKMMEKGKEKRWTQLSIDEKKNFDVAQARELSNVMSSKALRSLTMQEMDKLDYKTVASMRWVLTTKSDGSAKARLVVLGFQMGNITEVQTSAPTMARVSRNLLLAICSNNSFRLKGGDVTAAFLQTDESLDELEMNVWAPAELAVAFGAPPSNPVLPLRISKAFYGLVQAPRCWFNDISSKMKKQGWKGILADRCIFILNDDDDGRIIGAAGLHVDDLLTCGDEKHPKYVKAEQELMNTYKWGKWQSGEIEFAGCTITQLSNGSLQVHQKSYVDKWLEEIYLPKERQKQLKSPLTDKEKSMLRGAIGSIAWKSSQTGPHFQADAGMLLSEIPYANVQTIHKTNKLIREIKRESHQCLLFPCWNVSWKDMVIVTWCDAGQQNRPDKSSTLGYISGIAPKSILEGEEVAVAIINWKSSKTPRQCLGSNGAESQAITEGEDHTFKLRAMWSEMHGMEFTRPTLYDKVKAGVGGALVMDTRGIYDAMTRNVSSLHGLRSSRAGYELTLAVNQAMKVDTKLRWVNGLAQLGDCLTKANERKVFLKFLANGQKWRLVHDEQFIAGRKVRKRELEQATRDMQQGFVMAIKEMARTFVHRRVGLRAQAEDKTEHKMLVLPVGYSGIPACNQSAKMSTQPIANITLCSRCSLACFQTHHLTQQLAMLNRLHQVVDVESDRSGAGDLREVDWKNFGWLFKDFASSARSIERLCLRAERAGPSGWEEVLPQISEHASRFPTDAQAWIYLARAKMALGGRREAYRALQEALALDGNVYLGHSLSVLAAQGPTGGGAGGAGF
eukprot:s1426_g5.t1